jgi:predicted nucleotidyltransferase
MTISREELLRRIKSCILEIEPDAEIILYGSQARGDAREESDWDLLVLVSHPIDSEQTRTLRRKLRTDIEYSAAVALSALVRNKSEWNTPKIQATPFYENVSREGIAL